jgi:hypothetical protein
MTSDRIAALLLLRLRQLDEAIGDGLHLTIDAKNQHGEGISARVAWLVHVLMNCRDLLNRFNLSKET